MHFFLAKALLDLGDQRRWPEAVQQARRGLELAPTSESAPLGHYVLADLYRLQGRSAESERERALGEGLEQQLTARDRARASGSDRGRQ